jgi:xanthine dehydrogenase accessory factor
MKFLAGLYKMLNSMIQTKTSGVLGTIVSSGLEDNQGTKFLIGEKGDLIEGEVSEELLSQLRDPLQEVIVARKPKLVELSSKETPVRVFLDPIFPASRLIILGGGHIALPLARMGKLLNYEVTVVDDRPTFANPERFPEADQIYCQDFKSAIAELDFDTNTYVIVVTRGHSHDKTCLAEVLMRPQVAYVGMIGSRRKVAAIMNDLKEEGYSVETLDQVYTPIGLDIGAQTPEEIAVSIMAEIIMINRYGYSMGLKTGQAKKTGQGGIPLG